MRVLNRKLLREITGSGLLLLLIASIVAIGVTCFVAMQSAYHNLDTAKHVYYRQCRMADFWIDLKKAPLAELESLHEIDGVIAFQPRIQFAATVDLDGFPDAVNGLVVSLPEQRVPVINDLVMQQGEYFTSKRRNEVIVSEKFARQHDIGPGQGIHILLNNRREQLVVVGTALSSEFTYLVGPGALLPDPVHFGVFYVKTSYAEEVFDFAGAANQVVGLLSPQYRANPAEVLARIESRLEAFGVFSTLPLRRQVSNQFLSSEIDGLGAIATVIPAIFLAVAALVLNVLINRTTRRQRVVVGTLKAIGYSDAQVFCHFLLLGVSVGLAGGLIGSLCGYLAAAGMTAIYRHYFDFPDLTSNFYWRTHAIGISVSVVCAVLGSFQGSLAVLRLRPAEAMRPEPPRAGKTTWAERLLGQTWHNLALAWRMAIRGICRHPGRTTTGMFAAMMGSGLLVCGFMLTEAQNYLLDFQFRLVERSDIDLVFKETRTRQAVDELQLLRGVERVEPLLNVACTFANGPYRRKGVVTGLSQGAELTLPRNTSGKRIPIPEFGVVMTRRMARLLHLRSGSPITMIPVQGDRRPVELVVMQIADSYMGTAVYGDIRYVSKLVGEPDAVNGAQIGAESEYLRPLYQELKSLSGIKSIHARRDMVDTLKRTLLQNQYVFIVILVVFAGTIFFGSIVNTSMVSLAERKKEVATLLALGYTEGQIGAVFLRENLVTNGIGGILGMPMGYILTWVTSMSYETDVIRLPVVASQWIWVTTLIASGGFALLAHITVHRAIVRLDYLEALKTEE